MRYETDCTSTCTSIARDLGCTRQAVANKAKAWTKATDKVLSIAEQLDITKPVKGSALGKRSPENIAALVNTMALCRNEELACNVIGINPSTLYRWKEQDPELARLIQVARAAKVVDWISCIDRAAITDWKAADRLLKIAPETKDTFGEIQDKGPTIVLNIHRDTMPVTIDQ